MPASAGMTMGCTGITASSVYIRFAKIARELAAPRGEGSQHAGGVIDW